MRSAAFPLGVPGLSSFHQAKVNSANLLYALAIEILVFCSRRGTIINIANPVNRLAWAALVLLSAQHSGEAATAYNALENVVSHACCHGSQRRKSIAWLGTASVFSSLTAVCQNDHEHAPWGVRWNGGGWVFDTSSEAAYPTLLAQRVTACLVQVATRRGLSLQPSLRSHDLATATRGKQSKKHHPLIPEFHRGAPLLAGTAPTVKLGHYHTPKQFLSMAKATTEGDHVDHLEQTAEEEISLGFVEGPFEPEEQVTAYFGHDRWSVRRFVLVQGAEMKLHPVDVCLEVQINQGFTSSSYLKLQDIDYIAGMALRVASAVAGGKQRHGSGRWQGKCLDLSKAYKQVRVLPTHRHLSVIIFHDIEGLTRQWRFG